MLKSTVKLKITRGKAVSKKEEAGIQEVPKGFSVGGFLKGTKEELDKVVWPTRQQLLSESAGVLLMVMLSATLIYLIDNFFRWSSGQVFG
nr:preprotein translocase subunit SecE [Arthrospira platensis]